ncbi:hypothetical protein [Actinoplanes sp. NPDC049802]|uniref:hypothetical protein n=1 Tax=Actinoplanes sp. NPDC049802 TaxID=3154742 RepID=UPI0033C6FD74
MPSRPVGATPLPAPARAAPAGLRSVVTRAGPADGHPHLPPVIGGPRPVKTRPLRRLRM